MQQKQTIQAEERYYYPSPYNHIIQSNDLVRTTNTLSLTAERLFLVALTSIKNLEDKEFIETTLFISDLNNLFNSKSKDFHNQMKKAAHELLKTSIFIYDEKNSHCTEYNLMKSCRYYLTGASVSAIKFSFNEELKPYLLELKKNYIDIPLEYVLNLKSRASIDLIFFLLKRFNIYYNNAPKEAKATFSKTITVSKLELMQLFTHDAFYQYQMKKDWDKVNFKYDSFKRLSNLAIKKPVDEINKQGYFKIEHNFLRNDVENPRNISHIEFNITVGQKLNEFNKNKVEHSRKVKEHKEFERIAEYFMNRFNTYEGTTIKFVQEHNYSVYVMKLAVILLQSYLEVNSCGRYVKNAWKENGGGIRCKNPFKFLEPTFNAMSFIKDINDKDKAIDKYRLKQWVGDMTLEEELRNPHFQKEIDELFDKALQITKDNHNENYYYDREVPDNIY